MNDGGGGGERRNLQPFFCFRSNFRPITLATQETLATQASRLPHFLSYGAPPTRGANVELRYKSCQMLTKKFKNRWIPKRNSFKWRWKSISSSETQAQRLSLALNICPWVSQDGSNLNDQVFRLIHLRHFGFFYDLGLNRGEWASRNVLSRRGRFRWDLRNSLDDTTTEFNNCFIIHSK